MLAKTGSVALVGVDAKLVDVEVDVNVGVPKFTIVGLPAKSVREAEQRTRSALQASGERWPPARVVANLAPASLRKDGTHFDLPIALGLIQGDGRLKGEGLEQWVVMGELGLDGSVRRVRGVLAAAIACKAAGKRGLICPATNAAEAAVVDGIAIVAVSSLAQCTGFFRGRWTPDPVLPNHDQPMVWAEDLSDVRGQDDAKRALEIAAAGGHNLLLRGSPGSGKTMIATRLPGILPLMSAEEAVEVTQIHSVAGLVPEGVSLIRERPFRCPHHNVSMSGLIGGGSGVSFPGEATLAHQGVLFLDESPLYRRDVLESLRGPVEEGSVHIARVGGAVRYPCRFSLIAAMNPCPCGFEDDSMRACRCSHSQRRRYLGKLSGPLLDRFDMQVQMLRLTKKELLGPPDGAASSEIRGRVEGARALQADRYGNPLTTNASAAKSLLERTLELTSAGRKELSDLVDGLALNGRGIGRVLRVARTIADLTQSAEILGEHISEAVLFRFLEDQAEVAA